MDAPLLQLLVLAGIAVFLVIRLRSVLGTREGFEKPTMPNPQTQSSARNSLKVIDGGPDRDIIDHVEDGSADAIALGKMKKAEPSFGVSDFLQGARSAYEMILMGFERGELDEIKPFLSEDVYEAFVDVIGAREDQGLTVEAEFIGVREINLTEATFDDATNTAEISMKFVAELTSLVRDRAGDIIEGKASEIKRQKDTWTFSRVMGTDDPNWRLVDTDA
jgi:predicted lipid-binding transport protein (Tim44 family)